MTRAGGRDYVARPDANTFVLRMRYTLTVGSSGLVSVVFR